MKRQRKSRWHYDFMFCDDEGKQYKFFDTIAAMMYTFGDVREPLPESVKLMHTILRDQMNILLNNVRETAYERGRNQVCHEEVLWLMRKSKVKLRGMLEYLKIIDYTSKLEFETHMEICEDSPLQNKKRFNMCMKFLASIEDCDEFTSVLRDESIWTEYTRRRMERRSMMTELMKISEYEEFAEALKVSFCPSEKVTEFRKWLMEGQTTNIQFTPLALVMIGFLVREMIAEIVDMVLCKRSKKSNRREHWDCCSPGDGRDQKETRFLKVLEENKITGLEHSINISEKEISVFSDKKIVDHLTKNKRDDSKALNAPDNVVSLKENEYKPSGASLVSGIFSPQVSNKTSTVAPAGGVPMYESSTKNSTKDSDSEGSAIVTTCISDISDSPSIKTNEENLSDFHCPESAMELDGSIQKSQTYFDDSEAIVDISDCEDVCDTKMYSENTAGTSTKMQANIDTSSASNYPEALKKEFLQRKAITPEEIREVFVRFNEPSPLAYYFSSAPVHCDKKLYLGESWDY